MRAGESAQFADQLGHQATLQLLLRELDRREVGCETAISRLLDVLFVNVLRHWLDTAEAKQTGWLGALRDEAIGRFRRSAQQ